MKVTPDVAAVIKFLHKEKTPKREIARRVGVSEAAVRATLKNISRALEHRARKKSQESIKKRRKIIVAIAKEKLKEKCKGRDTVVGAKFSSLGEIAKEYSVRVGGRKTVAPATVGRDLNACGFSSKMRPRVVNNDPVKNKARLAFCQGIRKQKVKASTIVFSDECWVNDNENTNRREWTAEGESPTPRRFQKRPTIKLMVWGAIGVGYKSPLVFMEESVTAAVYQRRVVPVVIGAMRSKKNQKSFFMQDGARPHTARSTVECLGELRIKTLDWPAHSPHLNPIEKLWNTLHKKVAELRPKTEEELRRCALNVWAGFKQPMINKLVASFDASVAKSIRNKGEPW